jgi:hypothetical protein
MYVWSNIVTQSLNNFCNGKALMRCFVCCLVTHYSQQYKNIECTTKTAFKVNLFRWQQYNILYSACKMAAIFVDFNQILSFLAGFKKVFQYQR